jgi:hypothetical protein
MPGPGEQHDRTWHKELQPLQGGPGTSAARPIQKLQHVSAVWQSVDGGGSTAGAAYHYCFQGF